MEKENSYRSILKGMSFFGGAQVFQILINLVRGKFVALLLGPEGMGISSLLSASSATIQQLASAGIPTSIVKEVSAADNGGGNDETIGEAGSGNQARILEAAVAAARSATRATAYIGALICVAMSVLLSRWTFGSDEYAMQYVMLGLAVMLGMLGTGEMSILQGLHQVKRLSGASVVGAATGLAVGVPLYYFFGNDGIVPGMIAVALASYVFYRLSTRRALGVLPASVDRQLRRAVTRRLITLGFVLMAGSLIGSLVTYLSNAFIRYIGGIDDVGYFQAANSLTNQYAGVIFAAMSADYFPRLMAVASDNRKVTEIVNRQTEIIALIMSPLMILLMLSAPLVVRILLTDQFLHIVPLVRWLGAGLFLRALAYPCGYIAFAKSDKRLFFILEGIVGNVVYLTANCTCYYFWGLTGLGIAMVATYMVSLAVYYAVNGLYYSYRLDRATVATILTATFSVSVAFAATLIPYTWAFYTSISVVFILSATYSFKRLYTKLRR